MAVQNWAGALQAVTLAVPDPLAAIPYYAELFGAQRADDGIVFSDGSRIRLIEGAPASARAVFEVADGSIAGTVEDREGRVVELAEAGELDADPAVVGPTLGHLTFESVGPLEAQAFYEALGFRLSEGLDEEFRWLRCNAAHHSLAFSRGGGSGLHHVGVDYPDAAALVRACDRVTSLGHPLEYGPGRHMVGNNLFAYFHDRNGIRFELLSELRRVERTDEPAVIHQGVPRERSVNLWGPLPPQSFRKAL